MTLACLLMYTVRKGVLCRGVHGTAREHGWRSLHCAYEQVKSSGGRFEYVLLQTPVYCMCTSIHPVYGQGFMCCYKPRYIAGKGKGTPLGNMFAPNTHHHQVSTSRFDHHSA